MFISFVWGFFVRGVFGKGGFCPGGFCPGGFCPDTENGMINLNFKVQMKLFFVAEFERAAKIRKIAVYHFLISLLVPEL